jgi:hypothetical protein
MPRAYWKGYLRLSLVTYPIELFPAKRLPRFSKDQMNMHKDARLTPRVESGLYGRLRAGRRRRPSRKPQAFHSVSVGP